MKDQMLETTLLYLQCTVKCGEGKKTRKAVCLTNGRISENCRWKEKPDTEMTCLEIECTRKMPPGIKDSFLFYEA